MSEPIIQFNEKFFTELLQDLFGFETRLNDSMIEIFIKYQKDQDDDDEDKETKDIKKFSIDIHELREKLKKFKKVSNVGETAIRHGNSYEFLINFERRSPLFIGRRIEQGLYNIDDSTNNISYKLSEPSDAFLFFFLINLKQIDKTLLRKSISTYRMERYLEVYLEKNDFFGYLKKMFYQFMTVEITSKDSIPNTEFERIGTSYLFQLGYNLNIPIIRLKYIEELVSPSRILRLRRGRPGEIDPPRRVYIDDLVTHYQMAISSDSPVLQFLSFFHVLEYFFEEIYREKIIKSVRDEITKPGFSFTRDKDINKLINFVIDEKRKKKTEPFFEEESALKLTLMRYVIDLNKIRSEIESYNQELIEYYKNNEVPFSKGSKIDLTDADSEKIYRNIAHRIYKSRNAIVHSKESNKPVYTPFKHDKDLLKEIPLIRFISEEIIIASSPKMITFQEQSVQ